VLDYLNLKRKLVLIGLLIVSFPLAIIAAVTLHFNDKMAGIAQQETSRLAEATLDNIVTGVYNVCEARHKAVLEQVVSGINIAAKMLRETGKVSFSGESVEWNAVNQYTKDAGKIMLQKMMAGDTWLGQNFEMDRPSPVVDAIRETVGGTCTVFQRMNKAGDMLRVSTNVLKQDGTRAIGTYIPRINPDGLPNPVLDAVFKGRRFTGRAFVVNDWYITAYDPLYDAKGKIIGMLYMGIPQDQGGGIRGKILNMRIGESGYAYVLDSQGKYVISFEGKRDGEDISQAKDANGVYFIREICSKALGLEPGEIEKQRYPWKNSGDTAARVKVAKIAYFEPWDWVIGIGAYEDEVFEVRDRIMSIGGKSRQIMMTVFAGALVVSMLVWYLVARMLSGRIGFLSDGLLRSSNEIVSATGQISGSSRMLAKGAGEHASALEETTASLEEISSMTKQNADNTADADRLTRETGQAIEKAGNVIDGLNTSMGDISEVSHKTSKIIKTIDEIAFQTNLLALNAAVEAARAGEAGAGFAVVADEVRNLALRSGEAARQTAALIDQTVKSVETGQGAVQKTSTTFEEVKNSADKVRQLIENITTASREQANGIEQINRAIVDMDGHTHKNASAAEASASASEQMNAEALEMKHIAQQLAAIVESKNEKPTVTQSIYRKPGNMAVISQPATGYTTSRTVRPMPFRGESHTGEKDLATF
jgi:methyl-accepting chemotaxis protein